MLLRRKQYRVADDPLQSCRLARMMIFGKVFNARWSVERTRRDHALRIDGERFAAVSAGLRDVLARPCAGRRPIGCAARGSAAVAYFSILDEMILQSKDTFFFTKHSRRPPLDAFNALLSFAYSLLARDCASALEAVGLDAYVGFLHRDRPGRESLGARPDGGAAPLSGGSLCADNGEQSNHQSLRILSFRESGAVFLTEAGRRTFLQKWQEHKREIIKHPVALKENSVGNGAVCPKSPAGALPARRFGGLSAVLVEMRCAQDAGSDYL